MKKESMQSLGGKARAETLTPGERREIARNAAAKRWNIPKATHEGVLQIAGIEIPCAVLEDGTRVLSRAGFLRAMGRTGGAPIYKTEKGKSPDIYELPIFMNANNLKPFITKELEEYSIPIPFRPPGRGRTAIGYKAELLPQVCSIFMMADESGVLRLKQSHIAQQCKILIRGFAITGLTALIDEATGYQEVRDKQALAKILEMYISKELAKWAKCFPDEFYERLFALNGWQYDKLTGKKPMKVGQYTSDFVYERIEADLLKELRKVNPKDEKGKRKSKHHQWLTPDFGSPRLRDHLNGVIALMRAAPNFKAFIRLMDRAYPKKGHTIEMNLDDI